MPDELGVAALNLHLALDKVFIADGRQRRTQKALDTCELEFRYAYVWQTSINLKGETVLTSTNERAREVEISFALSQDSEYSALKADAETAAEEVRAAKHEVDLARIDYQVALESLRFRTATLKSATIEES